MLGERQRTNLGYVLNTAGAPNPFLLVRLMKVPCFTPELSLLSPNPPWSVEKLSSTKLKPVSGAKNVGDHSIGLIRPG